MTKKTPVLKDIQGVQICIGDKVALIEKRYHGPPLYTMHLGKVVGFNQKSFKYVRWVDRDKNVKYPSNRLYPAVSSLVIDGEFVRDGKVIE